MSNLTEQQIIDLFEDAPEDAEIYIQGGDDYTESFIKGVTTFGYCLIDMEEARAKWVYQDAPIELINELMLVGILRPEAKPVTSPTFTSGQEVFIAQINTLCGIASKRYFIKEFWCDSGHQNEYVDLGLIFDNKKDAESKCRELVGLPPAPIELIDGCAYQFTYVDNNKKYHGIYNAKQERFLFIDGHVMSSYCKDIQLLEVKS